jgi:hypothetical protein
MVNFFKKLKLIIVDVLLPLVAVVLSLVALFISQAAQDDVARVEAVKTQYGMYDDLARLQLDNPLMTHLFANKPSAYKSQIVPIKNGTSSAASADRARLMLQERAVAHYIFTDYEETYFLFQQAAGGEERRRSLLQDNLDYFNNLLCGNPRLLWYWSQEGGKLGQEFAKKLQNYYIDNVLEYDPKTRTNGCITLVDSQGPFSTQGETK